MVRPIRKSEADLIARIGSSSISVGVEDLLGLWKALDSAALYFLNRDSANASLHLESVRRSPLTIQLVNERDQLEKILVDSIPKDPPQPEGSSEKTQEKPGE